MEVVQLPDTHDLRSPAVSYKRDRTQAAKWALTPVCHTKDDSGAGETATTESHPRRPVHPHQRANAAIRRLNGKDMDRASHQKSMAEKFDVREQLDPDGVDVGLAERPSAAAPDDEGVTYSFDAPTGPHEGNHVLGQALVQAVERFEGQVTEKLVMDEYEVVGPKVEPARRARREKQPDPTECEDFELV